MKRSKVLIITSNKFSLISNKLTTLIGKIALTLFYILFVPLFSILFKMNNRINKNVGWKKWSIKSDELNDLYLQ